MQADGGSRGDGVGVGSAAPRASEASSGELLLECRIELLETGLEEARAEADKARERLALALEREAEQARRYCELQEELAEARAELLELWRRLERAEARSEARASAHTGAGQARAPESLTELQREAQLNERRAEVRDRVIDGLRGRLEEMSASRERLFARVAEWQRLVREDGPEAADLAEFIAELRGEILSLEGERAEGQRRELALLDSLARAGPGPAHDAHEAGGRETGVERMPPTDDARVDATIEGRVDGDGEAEDAAPPPETARPRSRQRPAAKSEPSSSNGASVSGENGLARSLRSEIVRGEAGSRLRAARRLLALEGAGASASLAAAVSAADEAGLRAALLSLLGRSGDAPAVTAVRPWLKADDARVRAAAYEAACRLLEGKNEELGSYLRAGLTDDDAFVRRRAILAAATARSVSRRPLLEPLLDDPNPEVRRLVRQVLSRVPRSATEEGEDVVLALTIASSRAGGAGR